MDLLHAKGTHGTLSRLHRVTFIFYLGVEKSGIPMYQCQPPVKKVVRKLGQASGDAPLFHATFPWGACAKLLGSTLARTPRARPRLHVHFDFAPISEQSLKSPITWQPCRACMLSSP